MIYKSDRRTLTCGHPGSIEMSCNIVTKNREQCHLLKTIYCLFTKSGGRGDHNSLNFVCPATRGATQKSLERQTSLQKWEDREEPGAPGRFIFWYLKWLRLFEEKKIVNCFFFSPQALGGKWFHGPLKSQGPGNHHKAKWDTISDVQRPASCVIAGAPMLICASAMWRKCPCLYCKGKCDKMFPLSWLWAANCFVGVLNGSSFPIVALTGSIFKHPPLHTLPFAPPTTTTRHPPENFRMLGSSEELLGC